MRRCFDCVAGARYRPTSLDCSVALVPANSLTPDTRAIRGGLELIAEMDEIVRRAGGRAFVDRLSLLLLFATSIFTFEAFTIGSFFSLVDSILADRFRMIGSPVPG